MVALMNFELRALVGVGLVKDKATNRYTLNTESVIGTLALVRDLDEWW